jgi:hypothetical protein
MATNNNFVWDDEETSDVYRTLVNLINYNGGLWKSEKQAYFFSPKVRSWHGSEGDLFSETHLGKTRIHTRTDSEFLQSNFGITIGPGEYAIILGGRVAHASYGGRSIRSVEWGIVLDKKGVVRKYRLHRRETSRGGTGINPDRTELEWERGDTNEENRKKKSAKPKPKRKVVKKVIKKCKCKK